MIRSAIPAGLVAARMAKKGLPKNIQPDTSLAAFLERMRRLEKLLLTKIGLPKEEVEAALLSRDSRTKEKTAEWLRSELRRLRSVQNQGGHPVRRGDTISLLEIADLAFTMLESTNPVHQQLLLLIKELLNVDRHRRTTAFNRDKFENAAGIEARSVLEGHVPSVRDIARAVSISVSTASQWKQSSDYRDTVEFYKKGLSLLTARLVDAFMRIWPEITEWEAFRISMRVLADPKVLVDALDKPVGDNVPPRLPRARALRELYDKGRLWASRTLIEWGKKLIDVVRVRDTPARG